MHGLYAFQNTTISPLSTQRDAGNAMKATEWQSNIAASNQNDHSS